MSREMDDPKFGIRLGAAYFYVVPIRRFLWFRWRSGPWGEAHMCETLSEATELCRELNATGAPASAPSSPQPSSDERG